MSLTRYPPRGYSTVYTQTFDTAGVGGWTAGGNTTGLVRSTNVGAGYPSGPTAGSLVFAATGAGNISVQSPFITVAPNADVLMTGRIALGGSGTYGVRVNLDWWNSGSYINGIYDWNRSAVPADGVFRWLLGAALLPGNANQLTIGVTVFSAVAAQQVWLDNVTVWG